jgi:hypothetical protein
MYSTKFSAAVLRPYSCTITKFRTTAVPRYLSMLERYLSFTAPRGTVSTGTAVLLLSKPLLNLVLLLRITAVGLLVVVLQKNTTVLNFHF